MGTGQEKIGYKVSVTTTALNDLSKLDTFVLRMVERKINWLRENADIIIHHRLVSMPDSLKGLCRIHAGNWRILYWIYQDTKVIKIYGIEHRSKVYKKRV